MNFAVFLSTLLLALPADTTLPKNVDPALFPGVMDHPADEITLAGLSVLYPGRVLHEAPQLADPDMVSRPPIERDIPPHGITYLRVYDLKSASLQKLGELLVPHATVILDLRFVYANFDDADELANTLKKAGLAAKPVKVVISKDSPGLAPPKSEQATVAVPSPPLVLVLVNRKTAGPLEAWLAAFQDAESIQTVGAGTAGQPGTYAAVPGLPDYRVMVEELQPEGGSIAGAGLQPRFPVEVTPEQSYRSYYAFEKSPPPDITALLRQNRNSAPAPAPTAGGNTTAGGAATAAPSDDATDATLQRAVDVVAALQLLAPVPSSARPPATKAILPTGSPASSPPANTKN